MEIKINELHNTMTAELAVKVVKNACLNVQNPEGIILQSDLGTQYTSEIFEKYLAENGIIHSFSRKGCPYDNACIESFHSLIKKEEIYRRVYRDSKEAYNSIFEYIESWYKSPENSQWLRLQDTGCGLCRRCSVELHFRCPLY